MRFLWTTVRKDLSRLRRDPLVLGTSLGIPLVLVILIGLIFSGGQAAPQGRVLVADEDKTLLSQLLTGAFSREPLAKMFVLDATGREEGRRRMDRGDATALLIVPKGFQAVVFQNYPAQLQLVTNPAQTILPNILVETLSTAVDGGFYLQRLAATPLRSIVAGEPPSDDTVAQMSVAFNRLGRSLSKYLNPVLIDLDLNVTAEKQETQNVGAIFLPAMIFMGLLFTGNALALDIWKEQSWGTLRRLATTPASLGSFLGGRLVSVR